MPALSELESFLALPPAERVGPLARVGLEVGGERDLPDDKVATLRDELVRLLSDGVGTSRERLQLGEALGALGDPRLRRPADADYWADVPVEDGRIRIGRHLVTNAEFREFVDAGGYDDPALWTDEGRAWLASGADRWPDCATRESMRPFLVPNQPVVCVTWHEAMAYAAFREARLARFDERLFITRGGDAKRPYPWGSPFGEGKANTKEEVLGRPCAVGLYLGDRTPEGVYDLAGNVAEWTLEGAGDQYWVHPGAWDQPSMAAWAKARELESPEHRALGLGFRLARD